MPQKSKNGHFCLDSHTFPLLKMSLKILNLKKIGITGGANMGKIFQR